MKKEILVIDDNSDLRFLVCNILSEKNFIVRSAANYDQALYEINKKLPDLVILDIKLDKADKDGIDLLKTLMSLDKSLPVIMISGHATSSKAVEAIHIGAYEFIEKPFKMEKILNYVYRALEAASLKEEKSRIEDKLFHSFDLIGESNSITKIRKTIEKLSTSDSRVMISGPTGSGKELVARKIHKFSTRKNFPFIVLNAALLKEKKYEKELFGEELSDGSVSFGVLERANKGTLLIDEITEIPLDTQANILRILTDQKFKRVNGSKDILVNIRIISSSSKDLNRLVKENNFREDLFHRLNVVPIEIVPLSQRTEDIPHLINYFKKKLADLNGVKESNIDVKNGNLYTHDWPGNIRELRNLIERVTILSSNENPDSVNNLINDVLNKTESLFNSNIESETFSIPLKDARKRFEREYLITQLKKNHGNISKTADFIGMERSALHRKLKQFGIKDIN